VINSRVVRSTIGYLSNSWASCYFYSKKNKSALNIQERI